MPMVFRFPANAQPSIRGAAFRVPGWSLRTARRADEGFLRQLFRTLRAEELGFEGWDEPTVAAFCNQQFDFQHADWTRRYPRAQFRIVTRDGAPIGRVYLDLSGAALHLIDIALLPEWRRRGFGTAALVELKRRAVAVDGVATLHVSLGNPGAASLYAREGFVGGDVFGNHLAMAWRPEDAGATPAAAL